MANPTASAAPPAASLTAPTGRSPSSSTARPATAPSAPTRSTPPASRLPASAATRPCPPNWSKSASSSARPASPSAPPLPNRRKKTLSERFAPDIRAEIDRFVGTGPTDTIDFESVETAVRRTALQLAARAVEQRLDADLSDCCGPFRSCPCGLLARYAGRRPKTFETVLGPLTLSRAYYHCPSCGRGGCPRDAALGLAGSSLSPAVLRMTGSAAALVSFAETADLLAALAAVRVEAKQVERCAEALGREIAAAERDGAFPSEGPPAPTMYLGLDGTGLPVRKSGAAGRAGKQPDGTAKTRV